MAKRKGQKDNPVKVGDKFRLNCGIEVEVIGYIDVFNIIIRGSDGNEKRTKAQQLRKGSVSWKEFGVHTMKSDIKLGQVWPTKYCGNVEVVKYKNKHNITVKFANTGHSVITNRNQIKLGSVIDDSLPKFSITSLKFPIGSRWESFGYGAFYIMEVQSCDHIKIRWEESGHEQVIKSNRMYDKKLRDESMYKHWDYLKPVKGRSYVYLVHHNDELIYIGQGSGQRYLHPTSGKSNNFYLNKLFFAGEKVVVSIFKDDLSREDALELEKSLIIQHKPICNYINNDNDVRAAMKKRKCSDPFHF